MRNNKRSSMEEVVVSFNGPPLKAAGKKRSSQKRGRSEVVQPANKTADSKMMSFNNCNVTIIHNNHYHQHAANQAAVVYDLV